MKASIIYVILIVSAISIGCEQPILNEQTTLKPPDQLEIHTIEHHNIEILEIDGCEYIIYKEKDGTNLAYGYMAHKGNCKNPIHAYKMSLTNSDTFNTDSKQLMTDIIE